MARAPTITIRNGRVICPAGGLDEVCDLALADGRIAAVAPAGRGPDAELEPDATGLIVDPGLVDVHVHLREPGAEAKETIATGTRAALRGGFTSVCAMANTVPAPDCLEAVSRLRRRIGETAWCRAYPIGAATMGNARGDLTDFAALKRAGCVAISDDAFPLRTREQRREALLRAAEAGIVFIAHLEDQELSADGVMHEGPVSRELGVPGQPAETEVRCLEAWREAWEQPGAPPLHLAHVSTAATVELLRDWQNGPTAETAPHYLALTDQDVSRCGAYAKMNPPLRTEEDRQALRQAVADGTLGVLATDHAPHTAAEKARGLLEAPFGIVGLETALAVIMTEMVWPRVRGERAASDEAFERGPLSMAGMLARMSRCPAERFGLAGGSLTVGRPADVVVVAPGRSWVVHPDRFASKGRNTPFAGQVLRGAVEAVVLGGDLVVRDGEITPERPRPDACP